MSTKRVWCRSAILRVIYVYLSGLGASMAQGATFDVATPAAFQSALVTAGGNGADDTIRLAAGTYVPVATFTYSSAEDHSLRIEGAGEGATALDGSNLVQVLSIETSGSHADVHVAGIHFRRGRSAENGGALRISTEAAAITLENCEVHDSSATGGESVGGGAALNSQSGTITVSGCGVYRNESSGNVGGLFIGTFAGYAEVNTSVFESNRVDSSGVNEAFGDGGGLMVYSDGAAYVSIHGCYFEGNSASGGSNPDGGGLMTYQMGDGTSLRLHDNVFTNNTTGLGGGGCILRFNVSCDVEVGGNLFTHNRTLIGSGGGALVYINQGTLGYSNNQHVANQAAEDGGGAWINHIEGVAQMQGNLYRANQSGNNGGGLSFTTDSGTGTVSRNVFVDNAATNIGGGMSMAATTGRVIANNNTFYNNATHNEGGGLYVYLDQPGATSELYNAILWQSIPNAFGFSYGSGSGDMALTYSVIQGAEGETWFGTGCTTNNPIFRDAANGNFRLGWVGYPVENSTKSPCIDAGDPGSALDPDGTRADMGAYAFPQGLAARGTPHWWLEDQGLASGGEAYDEAELSDTDGDWVPAWKEFVAATDPNNDTNYFRIISLDPGPPAELLFIGYTSRVYTLQSRPDLSSGGWSNVPGAVSQAGGGGETLLSDTNVPACGPFYRLRVDLSP